MNTRNRDAGLYKRGRRWWIRLYVPGAGKIRRPLIPAGDTKATSDKNVARVLAASIRAELLAPDVPTSEPDTIEALLDAFEAAAGLTGSDEQAAFNASVARRFVAGRPIISPAQITPGAVEAYLVGLKEDGCALSTLRNHRSAISSFCKFLRRRHLLDSNPCRHVELARRPRRPPRYLNEAEYDQVMAVAKKVAKARGTDIDNAVALALLTGMRRGSLRVMKWAHVHLAERYILVPAKGNTHVKIHLNPQAVAVLRRQHKRTGQAAYVFAGLEKKGASGMRSQKWWIDEFRPIQDAVAKFTDGQPGRATGRAWHLLRHTFASRAVQRGVKLQKVSQWLGHTDMRTTQIYAHLADDYDPDIEKVQ